MVEKLKIQTILKEHALWLETDGKAGKKAFLSGANLQGADLSRANLQAAFLGEYYADSNAADLYGANLNNANLEEANLSYANLNKVFLSNANLSKANLTGANLRGAKLADTDLTDAVLVNTNLDRVDFKRTSLNGITIDLGTIAQLPVSLVNQYKESFIINEGEFSFVTRSIEFSEEYFLAGISILTYFGTILRQKYPDSYPKVTIEQSGLKVTLIIETTKGEQERIERSLNDYGLVLSGSLPIDEYLDNKIQAIQLKNELRLAETHINFQKDLIAVQDGRLEKLLNILGLAVTSDRDYSVTLNASPHLETNINQEINLLSYTHSINTQLEELKTILTSKSNIEAEITKLQEGLFAIGNASSREEVRGSSVLKKLRNFVSKLSDIADDIDKTVKLPNRYKEIARNLRDNYNFIAKWCGLPSIPDIF